MLGIEDQRGLDLPGANKEAVLAGRQRKQEGIVGKDAIDTDGNIPKVEMMCLLEEAGGGKIKINVNECRVREDTEKVLGHLVPSTIDALKTMSRSGRPQVGGNFM